MPGFESKSGVAVPTTALLKAWGDPTAVSGVKVRSKQYRLVSPVGMMMSLTPLRG